MKYTGKKIDDNCFEITSFISSNEGLFKFNNFVQANCASSFSIKINPSDS